MFVNSEEGGFHIYTGTSWWLADEERGEEGRQPERVFLPRGGLESGQPYALCDTRGSEEKRIQRHTDARTALQSTELTIKWKPTVASYHMETVLVRPDTILSTVTSLPAALVFPFPFPFPTCLRCRRHSLVMNPF